MYRKAASILAAVILGGVVASANAATTFDFNYDLDSDGFFSNPAAKTALEAAGQAIGSVLEDQLSAIEPSGGNSWEAITFDPADPTYTLYSINPTIAANTLLVYVGGHDFGTTGAYTLGEGGGTGGSWSNTSTLAFRNTVAGRGQVGATDGQGHYAADATDYGPWGGAISFNDNAGVPWNFSLAGPVAGEIDFYSVALHELGHVLGLGTAISWFDKIDVSNATFTGAAAEGVYGGPVPVNPGTTQKPDYGHWAAGIQGHVNGILQDAVMTPAIAPGMRKVYTDLDYAGLKDVGWMVSVPVPATAPAVVMLLGVVVLIHRRRRGRRIMNTVD